MLLNILPQICFRPPILSPLKNIFVPGRNELRHNHIVQRTIDRKHLKIPRIIHQMISVKSFHIQKSTACELNLWNSLRSHEFGIQSGIYTWRYSDDSGKKNSKRIILSFRSSVFKFTSSKTDFKYSLASWFLIASEILIQKSQIHLNPFKLVVQREPGLSRKSQNEYYTQNTNKTFANGIICHTGKI